MTLTTDTPELSSLVTGEVLAPTDPGYAGAVLGFNLATAHTPDYVVRAASAQDVAATVGYAAATGRRIAVQATGHGALAAGPGSILVLTGGLDTVTVDPVERTATVGPGTVWQQVLDAAAPHGLGGLCGSAPGAGVVGYTLGGGLSPIGRTFGFAADTVRSLEVVTADGGLRTVDPTSDPDLFWALRGGAAAFGLVTSLTFDLPEIPTLYAGGLFLDAGFDAAETVRLLRAWRDWAETLPEQASTSICRLNAPDAPFVPEPLRGKALVHLRFAYVGDLAEGERLAAPLRALGEPVVDMLGPLPMQEFGAIHADPTDPLPAYDGGGLFADLPDAAIDAFAEVTAAAAQLPFALAEIRLLGGAFARPPAVPNVVAGRDAGYLLNVVGMMVPPIAEMVPGAVNTVMDRLQPWTTGGAPANFAGFDAATGSALIRAGFGADLDRLDALRAERDPTGLLDPASRWERAQ